MLVSFLLCLKVDASPEKDARINLLDMTNVVIEYAALPDHGAAYYVTTKEPIAIKNNTTYTIIADERYYSLDIEHDFYREWSINNEAISMQPERYVSAWYGNWVYASFVSESTTLILDKLIINNYEENTDDYPFSMMIFEGTISDFKGYYGFNSVFDYEQAYYLADVESQPTLEEIVSKVNLEDSNATLTLLETTYQQNGPLGMYYIMFKAVDTFHNHAYYQLNVNVVDINPPVITGQRVYDKRSDIHSINESKIRNNLSVTDNIDGNIPVSALTILERTFYDNESTPGAYYILYEAKDSSNNKSTYRIDILVEDKLPPKINGPRIVYRTLTDGLLSEAEILSLFTATDIVEGDKPITITSNEQDGTLGKKIVMLSSSDSVGNTSTYMFIIVYVPSNAPIFLSNPLILTHQQYTNMTQEDIVEWLTAELNASHVDIILNETLYDEEGYIYFTYDKEGITYYGMVQIQHKPSPIPYIIVVSVIVLNGLLLWIYFKKKKF